MPPIICQLGKAEKFIAADLLAALTDAARIA
jgi:hypothetical protein